jgi:hypothetical protein
MMIRCQKCGFENQMGSIFCRECGEKLDMDAIDPNKLQKDVNKEKNIKLAKKRIRSAISSGIALLVVAAFLGVVFYNGGLRQYEEPGVTDVVARQKYAAAKGGSASGKVKYSYAEVNRMFKEMVVDPLAEKDSFAKVTNAEIAYDEEKGEPVVYLWISIKEKVPVIYTIHGKINYNPEPEEIGEVRLSPIALDVKRLDIGRFPVFVSTKSFLNGFAPLIQNQAIDDFFARAQGFEFSADGMTVNFAKGGGQSSSNTPPPSSGKPSTSTAAAALKGGSAAAAEKNEAARQKAEEEQEKRRQLEEERKRKAEEYKQQQKEKEEERKRKAEEEKERKKQEAEERRRKQEEENERRRQERENRRNNNYNNNYNNNSRSSRSSRSSRNRY